MKTLTASQNERLDSAIQCIDDMVAARPLHIPDELALEAVVGAMNVAARLLEAGQTISIVVMDEAGMAVAAAPLMLEPAAGR